MIQDEDDNPKEYRWESGYEKTWEAIQEDEAGRLGPSIAEMLLQAKRKRLMEREASVRLGIMRHVYIILDLSEAMALQDLKPTRQLCILKILEDFVPEFHEQNPISQLGIIYTQNKQAKKHISLNNNAAKNIEAVLKLKEVACRGEPSVQNSLEVALSSLKHLPAHTSREVIILYGALVTCDPGEIENTFQKIIENNIRVSTIGLAAEVRVCKAISQDTNGSFMVALNDLHLKELLMEHLDPPPSTQNIDHTLIKVGFPHQSNSDAKPAMCMCHIDDVPPLNTQGYYCPQCSAKYCDLPAECRVCGLMLVTAPHLARSYRHLFPLKYFSEIPVAESVSACCYGCTKSFANDKNVYVCSKCKQVYCCNCDIFLHETVHTCPGCASNPKITLDFGGTTKS